MQTDRILELGRKLLALAQGGVDGEREAAQRMLDNFLQKHGLEISDIEPVARTRRIVKNVTLDIKQMFINFCASIVGKDVRVNKCVGRNYYAVEMNDEEWMEFETKWPVYRKNLKSELEKLKKQHLKELKLMVSAFISKHEMYSKDGDEDSREVSSLTPEEIQEILDTMRLQEKLDDINFHKHLE
jgi:hypothetical protein